MKASKSLRANYDVIIVGAGIAGCTAAILYARCGVSVALVERQTALDYHKPLCTHYFQPGAMPVLRALGLYDDVAAVGLHSSMRLRSPFGAFTVPHGRGDRGLNIRRALFDPLLRHTADKEPGIDLYLGARLKQLIWEDGRCVGVWLNDNTGHRCRMDAALTVAADGRSSAVARLANLATRQTPNERFSFYAYHRGLARYPDDNVQVWLMDDGQSYVAAFPNDSDLTLVSCYVPHRDFPKWRGRVAAQYEAFVHRLSDAPRVSAETRVSDIHGMRQMPSLQRFPAWL